jgi:hypothetical protein
MKKSIAFLLLFLGCLPSASAQKVLLEQNVSEDTIKQNFGPNLKYFGHFYGGFGMIAGLAGTGSEIDYLKSHEFVMGYRFKYKLSRFYALGFETGLTLQSVFLKQEAGKTLPTSNLYEKEKLKFTNLGLGIYNRFNWGKRGNYIGNFIDLGVYGNLMPFKAHIYEADQIFGMAGPLDGIKKIKVRETGLKYISDTNYGFLTRIGFNRYVFYGTYRISDLFEKGFSMVDKQGNKLYNYAELPRLSLGFQIGIH